MTRPNSKRYPNAQRARVGSAHGLHARERSPPALNATQRLPLGVRRLAAAASFAVYSETYRAILLSPATGVMPELSSMRTITRPSFFAGHAVPLLVLNCEEAGRGRGSVT